MQEVKFKKEARREGLSREFELLFVIPISSKEISDNSTKKLSKGVL